MPKQVRFNGQVHAFPDSFTDEQIADALAQLTAPAEAPVPKPGAQPVRERSLSGFLGNVADSGAQFATDAVSGIGSLVSFGSRLAQAQRDPREALKLGQDFIQAVKASPEMGKAVFEALKDRYGSGEAIANTLYSDPVGVLADVSSVAGLAAGGAGVAGLAARNAPRVASTAGKVARVASQVERATNPLSAVAPVVARVAEPVSDAVIAVTVRPPANVRRAFAARTDRPGNLPDRPGGRRGIARDIKEQRVFSAESAERKLQQAQNETRAALATADETSKVAGVPVEGIPFRQIEEAVTAPESGSPTYTAELRAALGEHPSRANTVERRLDRMRDHLTAQDADSYSLLGAQELKQEAQRMAYDAGNLSNSPEQRLNETIARAFKEAIEERVPQVRLSNEHTQQALAAKKAFEAAEERGTGFSTTLATGLSGGVFALGGGLPVTIGLPLLMKAVNSPRAGAMTGIAINEASRALSNPRLQRAALATRGAEKADEDIVAELMRRALMNELGQ